MDFGAASSYRPVETRTVVVVAATAVAAFVGAWLLLHEWFYARDQIVDTPIYERYGDAIADGKVPYRDFLIEYPPAAVPVFAIPSLLRPTNGDLDGYRYGFEGLMLACGLALLLFVLAALARLRASPLRMSAAVALVVAAPLLLGSVVLSRFDLWPAALTVAAIAALVAGRTRVGGALLGLAFAAKLYPAVLLPLALAYAWRRGGRREAAWCAGLFAAAALAVFLPFLAIAPDGVWDSVTRQTSRPLQIESLGAGFLLVLHDVAGLGITMSSGHGSQNLAGTLPDGIAAMQTVVQVGVVAAIWTLFARGPRDPERLVVACAAVVAAFVAFGKVFSPQFLIWLIPLVPLVRGRRGVAAGALLALALVLTQLWFPYRYWELALEFDPLASWLVLARDLTIVALVVVLMWPDGRVQERTTGV